MSETTGQNLEYKFNPDSADSITTHELLATAMEPIPPKIAYVPTRLEYFSVKILQGLIIGRSDQILPKVIKRTIALAKELELALDVEQNL